MFGWSSPLLLWLSAFRASLTHLASDKAPDTAYGKED